MWAMHKYPVWKVGNDQKKFGNHIFKPMFDSSFSLVGIGMWFRPHSNKIIGVGAYLEQCPSVKNTVAVLNSYSIQIIKGLFKIG